MPGYDRTGPMGAGPITGWGRGRCGAYAAEGLRALRGVFRGMGQGGFPWGRGRGRRFDAGGRGFGWGGFPGGPTVSPSDEAEMLRAQLTAAEAEIGAMKTRLEELERKG